AAVPSKARSSRLQGRGLVIDRHGQTLRRLDIVRPAGVASSPHLVLGENMSPTSLSTLARRGLAILRRTVLLCLCILGVLTLLTCGQKGIPENSHHDEDPGPGPFPSDLPSDVTYVAGTMSGAFSVSSTGEATYTLALVIPPGRAGMQPSLALTYDSSMGDGGP